MKRIVLSLCAATCCVTLCAQTTDRPMHVPYGGEIMYSGRVVKAMEIFELEGSIELYRYLEKERKWNEKQQTKIKKLKARIEKAEKQMKRPAGHLRNRLNKLYDEKYDQPHTEAAVHPYIFMACPSFSEPYALAVDTYHRFDGGSESHITLLQLKDRPDAGKPFETQPPVGVMRMEVDASVADSLLFLLKLANIAATYHDPVSQGLDGTTYYFKHGAKVSRSHNDMGGNLKALIALFDNICNAVKDGDSQRIDDLVPEINRMVRVYRQIVPPDVHIGNIWD